VTATSWIVLAFPWSTSTVLLLIGLGGLWFGWLAMKFGDRFWSSAGRWFGWF